MLPVGPKASLAQFMRQRIFIDLLKKTDARGVRNDKRAPDHCPG